MRMQPHPSVSRRLVQCSQFTIEKLQVKIKWLYRPWLRWLNLLGLMNPLEWFAKRNVKAVVLDTALLLSWMVCKTTQFKHLMWGLGNWQWRQNWHFRGWCEINWRLLINFLKLHAANGTGGLVWYVIIKHWMYLSQIGFSSFNYLHLTEICGCWLLLVLKKCI